MNNDWPYAKIQMWGSLRLALGAALFITYFIYYCMYHYASLKKSEKPLLYLNMSDMGSKLYIFGLGILLSANYMQGCIFTTIFAYFSMLATIGVMLVQFVNITETLKSKVYLVVYVVFFAWYVGIMSDCYATWNSAIAMAASTSEITQI